jgi:hypothetical protein
MALRGTLRAAVPFDASTLPRTHRHGPGLLAGLQRGAVLAAMLGVLTAAAVVGPAHAQTTTVAAPETEALSPVAAPLLRPEYRAVDEVRSALESIKSSKDLRYINTERLVGDLERSGAFDERTLQHFSWDAFRHLNERGYVAGYHEASGVVIFTIAATRSFADGTRVNGVALTKSGYLVPIAGRIGASPDWVMKLAHMKGPRMDDFSWAPIKAWRGFGAGEARALNRALYDLVVNPGME